MQTSNEQQAARLARIVSNLIDRHHETAEKMVELANTIRSNPQAREATAQAFELVAAALVPGGDEREELADLVRECGDEFAPLAGALSGQVSGAGFIQQPQSLGLLDLLDKPSTSKGNTESYGFHPQFDADLISKAKDAEIEALKRGAGGGFVDSDFIDTEAGYDPARDTTGTGD